MSIVVPIGVIVAFAILCVVVAVLSSAYRADQAAIDYERSLFTRAIETQSERVLRQIEAVVTTEAAVARIRSGRDAKWLDEHVARFLQSSFDHDLQFLIDDDNRLVYSNAAQSPSAIFPDDARLDLLPIIAHMRSRARGTLVQSFVGRPSLVAAVVIPTADPQSAAAPHLAITVRYIDQELLGVFAGRVNLDDLRVAGNERDGLHTATYDLADFQGTTIARFAWTPKRPGAEIVDSVLPFFAVALAGFALLAAFVLRYMRRTAAAIAVGESRLRHLAMHDPLCGLPNRIYFGERLEAVIEDVRRGNATQAAVFYIDLDHFKEVNDTLGHPTGDELIRSVTLRLSRTLRGDDLVARLGGDEFAVISTIGPDPKKIHTIANRILTALCAPYDIHSQSIVIGASIGIAMIDRGCGGSADIMRYADMALYRAKNEGRSRACIYDAAMEADLSSRKQLESELREAIDGDKLELLYQPLVNGSGDKMIGVEALCRWTHPQRGPIPPTEFIPIAEHSGLIAALGNWVLRRACLDGRMWPGLLVAANVSPLQFRSGDFVATVERTVQETGFDPRYLELELTESTLIGNVDTAEAAMRRLKAMGVRLALDDFGTGYSSLLYLRRFPFDKIKIDRSFVHSIEETADSAAIVHAVVSLGRGLGMKVTAEGVETADQHLFLRAAGVHSMQGYRFGKPMPAHQITERLKSGGNFRPADDITALAG